MTWAVVAGLMLSAVPGWQALSPTQRAEVIAGQQQKPLPERLVDTSARFLGTPYATSPLGEGEGPDADPLIRFDAVDCVTFIETAMALSLAPTDGDVVPVLNRIRYAEGAIGYQTRNHITETQWVPNNVKAGFLIDRTATLGAAVTATKTLDAKVWSQPAAKALGLDSAHQQQGTFALQILPATRVLAAVKDAPSGLVVVVVRADRPTAVTRVSHVGLLIQTPKGPMLRHASRSFHKVVDEPLERYLKRNRDFGAWTIEGMAFFELSAGAPSAPAPSP